MNKVRASALRKTARKGWKTDAKHKKSLKRTKLALLVLGLIILLIVLGKLVAFIANLQQPISKEAFLPQRNYFWDGTSNLNLIIKTNTVSLLSFNPLEKSIQIYNLPDSLYLWVPGGYGSWKLSSIYPLGQADPQKLGAKFIKGSLALFFGVPIDGVIVFNGNLAKASPPQVINKFRDGIFAYIKHSSNIQTDLSSYEMFRFVWGVSKVRFDKVQERDLLSLNVLDKSYLPDNSLIYTAEGDRIDSISSYFAESNLVTEKASIAIFNATKNPGLAQYGARIISNLGGNVIFAANANNLQDKSAIYISRVSSEFTLKRVSQVFASDCSSNLKCAIIICDMSKKVSPGDGCLSDDPKILDSRANINIVLGNDFYLRN